MARACHHIVMCTMNIFMNKSRIFSITLHRRILFLFFSSSSSKCKMSFTDSECGIFIACLTCIELWCAPCLVFTQAKHWSLSWAIWMKCTLPSPIQWRSFSLSFPVHLDMPNGLGEHWKNLKTASVVRFSVICVIHYSLGGTFWYNCIKYEAESSGKVMVIIKIITWR
jgi:hypothetical protein